MGKFMETTKNEPTACTSPPWGWGDERDRMSPPEIQIWNALHRLELAVQAAANALEELGERDGD